MKEYAIHLVKDIGAMVQEIGLAAGRAVRSTVYAAAFVGAVAALAPNQAEARGYLQQMDGENCLASDTIVMTHKAAVQTTWHGNMPIPIDDTMLGRIGNYLSTEAGYTVLEDSSAESTAPVAELTRMPHTDVRSTSDYEIRVVIKDPRNNATVMSTTMTYGTFFDLDKHWKIPGGTDNGKEATEKARLSLPYSCETLKENQDHGKKVTESNKVKKIRGKKCLDTDQVGLYFESFGSLQGNEAIVQGLTWLLTQSGYSIKRANAPNGEYQVPGRMPLVRVSPMSNTSATSAYKGDAIDVKVFDGTHGEAHLVGATRLETDLLSLGLNSENTSERMDALKELQQRILVSCGEVGEE